MLMMMKSVAVLAVFVTLASCVPVLHHHDATTRRNYILTGLQAINVTRMQQIMHAAWEMRTNMILRAGVCNATMTAQWMECGSCMLDPCVMVLTHNCTYGFHGKHVYHNMSTHFRFRLWFRYFQRLGHYHTESETESASEEDPGYAVVSDTCKSVQHNTTACFEVQEKCHKCRGIKLDACLTQSQNHNSALQYFNFLASLRNITGI